MVAGGSFLTRQLRLDKNGGPAGRRCSSCFVSWPLEKGDGRPNDVLVAVGQGERIVPTLRATLRSGFLWITRCKHCV